ncbi:hypothetical protein IC582_025945 [Cucumis melo]
MLVIVYKRSGLFFLLSFRRISGRKSESMATLAAAAVRQARALARVSSPQSTANLIHKRGLAGAADHHGPPKVNCWQDPMSPSKWKEEHFVLVSLSGWGLLIFGGYKFFTRGKGNKDEKIVEASQ